ncbi:MAG: peptide chain release factor N(5)-glutamine methyltransferase [Chitinophagaceae bacterium]
MKYGDAEARLRQQLQTIYETEEAASIAGYAVENISGLSRVQRSHLKDESLPAEMEERLHSITARLLTHEPLQYVIGEAFFAGLTFFVDKNVLIPRPETEELVQWIVSDVIFSGIDVLEQKRGEADATNRLKIMDVGTGSGCIAIAIKNKLPKAEIWGCDVSDNALNIARRNGAALDIRVDFVGLNFLDSNQRKQLPTVDIIVSNPPYIPLKDKHTIMPNVLNYEPHEALFVPDNDPLIFYNALAQFGIENLNRGGAIYCEINEVLSADVVAVFTSRNFQNVTTKKDMQGKERMVKAML